MWNSYSSKFLNGICLRDITNTKGVKTVNSLINFADYIQWDPFITDTFGEQSFGRYTEVAFVEGLFCVQNLHLGPVYVAVISQLAFLQGWPLRGVPL